MNPLTLTMLFEMLHLWDKYELPDTRIHRAELAKLVRLDMAEVLEEDNFYEKPVGTILIRSKGIAHVAQLCDLELPVKTICLNEDGTVMRIFADGSAMGYFSDHAGEYIDTDF